MSLSKEDDYECKQAFNFYANNGLLDQNGFYEAMKCLGVLYNEEEKKEMEKEQKKYKYEDVAKYYSEYLSTKATQQFFVDEFKKIDVEGTGKMGIIEFKKMLTKLGERMKSEEIEALFKNCQKDGFIIFDDLAKELTKIKE